MLDREIIIEALEYMLTMDLDYYDLDVVGTTFDYLSMIKEGDNLIIILEYDDYRAAGGIENYQTRDIKELYKIIGEIWYYNAEEVEEI